MLSSRFLLIMCLVTAPVMAGVEVGGTRLIYDASKSGVNLSVKNPEKNSAYLIQSWLDNGNEKSSEKIPFIITPPLFRLDAEQENQIRIIKTGVLPEDRESIYWLSVKSIAATNNELNRLQISVRTRIKMIYRPENLKSGAIDAFKKLTVTRNGENITFTNPTPYYISLHTVYVGKKEITEAGMVPPLGSHKLKAPANTSGKISWRAINDYGGRTDEVSN